MIKYTFSLSFCYSIFILIFLDISPYQSKDIDTELICNYNE